MARLRRSLQDPVWTDAIVPTILIRASLLVFAVLAVVIVRPDALPGGSLLSIWDRWDSPHYLEIARHGYDPSGDPALIAFFPLLPALIALGSVVTDPLVAGMTISFLATLAAAVGLYRLTRLDDDRSTARLTVVAMSVFPTAFAFIAPYTEALFLACTVWAFVAARRGDWRSAGILALLAGLARLQGAFLLPALAAEYWLARRRIDRDAAWLLLAAGGPLVYLAINQIAYGDPFRFLTVQREIFFHVTAPPWEVVGGLIRSVATPALSESWLTVYLAPLLGFLALGATFLWTLVGRGARPSYAIYTGLNLLTFATLTWPISVPRYILGVFPMFIAIGRLARRPWLTAPLLTASVLTLSLCVVMFVTGHWAF